MKSRIGILTDRSAQFPSEKYLGQELVNILSFNSCNNHIAHPFSDSGDGLFPFSQYSQLTLLPSQEEIQKILQSILSQYNEVIVLVVSRYINPLYNEIETAITKIPGASNIHLINSQSISIGLGLLVQIAANAANRGLSADTIKELVRITIPKIYSIFCVKSLSFLYFSGLIEPAQAVVGEMLGINPCLLLENGHLIPTHKAKNQHHALDLLMDFSTEFDNLRNVALVYGDGYKNQDFNNLRARLNNQFSSAMFSEHLLNATVSSMIGPQTMGLVLMENL